MALNLAPPPRPTICSFFFCIHCFLLFSYCYFCPLELLHLPFYSFYFLNLLLLQLSSSSCSCVLQ